MNLSFHSSIFVTNGIITPTIFDDNYKAYVKNMIQIDFFEVRYDVKPLHKISEPDIYLRKVIQQTRLINNDFKVLEGKKCECGEKFMRGTYTISFWGKSQSYPIFTCPNCGMQLEDQETSSKISNFLAGLSTR